MKISDKITMSKKVANAFKNKVISNVSRRFGKVLELEDDTHAWEFEEIYDEVGIKSRLPMYKQEENYKIKRVKQYLMTHMKKREEPFIGREFSRCYDYHTTIFYLCDKNGKKIEFCDINKTSA
jgi:hypothetical protein